MKPIHRLSDDEFAELVQRSVALPEAPAALVQAAIGLWPARQTATVQEVARAGWRLVSAVLSFDSWASPPAALGMRAAASDTRHLLFSAQGRDIDLRISPVAGGFALTGQILGPGDAGVVELKTQADGGAQAAQAHRIELDPMGEFHLDQLSSGTYSLTLRMGGDEIVLPPIEVGPRSR